MRETLVGLMEWGAIFLFMVWIFLFAFYNDVAEIYYMLLASLILLFLAKLISKNKNKQNDTPAK